MATLSYDRNRPLFEPTLHHGRSIGVDPLNINGGRLSLPTGFARRGSDPGDTVKSFPMRRRRLRVVAALLLAVGVAVRPAAAADACAALPFQTLSHSCSGVCAANATCVAYGAAQPTPCALAGRSPKSSCVTLTGCVYQCFAPEKDTSLMRFYVLFNATRATVAPGASADSSADAADAPPYEYNDFVRRLGVLELPSSVKKVVISGGRNEDSAPRGDVVDLEIDPLAFSKTPKLTVLGFLNVDIGGRLPDFPTIMPEDIGALDLTNANIKEIPASLNKFKTLDSISLQRNLLTDVPATVSLPLLQRMFAGENYLRTFSATFPILTFLDLADNKLLQFPTVVFNMTKLNTLKLAQNPDMATVIFSTRQYEQLSALEEFSIDADAMDNSSCRADQIKSFRGLSGSVCVVSDEELASYVAKVRGNGVAQPSSTPTPTPGASGGSTQQPTASGGMSNTVLVVIIVAVALVCISGGVAAFLYCQRKRQKQVDQPTDDTNRRFRLARMNDPSAGTSGVSGSNGSAPSKKARHALLLSDGSVLSSGQSLWDDDEMLSRQLQLEDIEDLRVIGSGGFAIVWLVRYLPQNRLLASKRLIKDQVTRQKTMDFVMEIKLNMQLDHPNIVQLVGVAWTIETDLQALLEYMPNGDLRAHLESTSQTTWDAQKLQLAIDIVEALVYVHSFSPPLVHRDLKSRNVLLADDMKAKLCDFGVSRFASVNNTMTTAVGTGKWLAPEVVAGSKSYDESCDIYSLGVVMTELDTHRLPYDDVMGPQGHRLPEVAVLQMVSSGQIQPTLSGSCPDEIRQVVQRCLSFTPADRPSAMEVAYALRLALRAFSAFV